MRDLAPALCGDSMGRAAFSEHHSLGASDRLLARLMIHRVQTNVVERRVLLLVFADSQAHLSVDHLGLVPQLVDIRCVFACQGPAENRILVLPALSVGGIHHGATAATRVTWP